ncbi:LacI family transcriptional regulator [Stella humosa]|uniref:LacI family transcriptional regulator n=1 Tax=Stella humosa TaxID=94 RepID=A0A3N1M1S5_9PROT|nr:LacI family transcriptional regulator [Stella humosa]BBK31852.1 LacI family transcriptional regulator [Stella humosa]
MAGVSTATVSAALNGSSPVSLALQERVRAAVDTVGYRPDGIARSLRRGETRMLGLLLADITNPFTTAVVHAMEAAAHARGYSLMLCNSDEDTGRERTNLDLLRTHRADGVMLMPVGFGRDYGQAVRRALDRPAVLVDRTIPGLPLDAVTVDGATGTRLAVAHMIAHGHHRIAVLAGPAGVSASDERLAGYRQALADAGLAADPELVRDGGFRQGPAYAATLDLLRAARPPTALFACNNLMAIGMMRAVADMGLDCPGDLSVACFDDFDWAEAFRPRLTTVAQPTDAIGTQAVELLLDRLGGDPPTTARRLILQPRLVVRDSCAAPRR